jgi:hypothetical protein
MNRDQAASAFTGLRLRRGGGHSRSHRWDTLYIMFLTALHGYENYFR